MARRRKRSSFLRGLWWIISGIFKVIFVVVAFLFRALFFFSKGAGRTVASSAKKARSRVRSSPAVFVAPRVVSAEKGDFNSFQDRFANESMILLVAGRRGSGKSALGFRFLENLYARSRRSCFALGVRQSVLPSWISSVDDLENASRGGVVLIDEGAVSFGSRQSMSKKSKELGPLLAVARHKDLSLIFVTQNTGMVDKNVLQLCDAVLLKEGSLLQEKMERSVMKDLYSKARDALEKVPQKDRKSHCFVFDSQFEGLISVDLPSFWSSKVSKSRA